MLRALWNALDNLTASMNRLASSLTLVASEVEARMGASHDSQVLLPEANGRSAEVLETANGQDDEEAKLPAKRRR